MTDFDEKAFIARIEDMQELSDRRGAVYTHFLNERQQFCAERELLKNRWENFRFYGGVEDAERKMLCVYSEYFCPEDEDFPISCITFRYNSSKDLSHRDFLGAIMGLNFKREALGDILIDEGIAQVFVMDSICHALGSDIRKVGSVGVEVSAHEPVILKKQQQFLEIKGTVASLRFDCIVGLSTKQSRSRSSSMISSGLGEINYRSVSDITVLLKQGDIFSVRGYGKYKIKEISGVSKKGRIHVVVLKYC